MKRCDARHNAQPFDGEDDEELTEAIVAGRVELKVNGDFGVRGCMRARGCCREWTWARCWCCWG